jgi:NAD-dependent DNA ligase
MKKLGRMGFDVVLNNILKKVDIPILQNTLEQMKKLSPYEIDGIIVAVNGPYERNTKGNPDYLFAFKMTSEDDVRESTVRAVQWDISKTGQIKPVILIDPVDIEGVEVKQATAHHAKYVVENKLGPGAVVQIVRSGSVIPYIYGVLKQADKPQMPDDEYVWDETRTNIRVSETTKENSQKMCVKLISDFFSQMGIKFVSEATVTKLYDNGLNTLLKIIGASKGRLQQVPGIQERGAERIHTNIHEGLKNVKIHNVLGASSVLGYGVGKRRLEVLFQAKPDLLTWYKGKKLSTIIEEIAKIEGYSDIMARRVAENLPYAEKFYEAMKKYAIFESTKKATTSPKKGATNLAGTKIVMSGFRDKDLEEFIKEKGGKVVSAVSGAVTAVVASDKNSDTGKPEKAREMGIPVYGREEYGKMIGFTK